VYNTRKIGKKRQYYIVNFQAIKLELLSKYLFKNARTLYAQILDEPSSKEGMAFDSGKGFVCAPISFENNYNFSSGVLGSHHHFC
jgi:hypothetical protein